MSIDVAAKDWRPAATVEALRLRARFLRRIRAFFEARGVMEVCTPALISTGLADAHLHSIAVVAEPARYLHTSPEYAMKRLLAAGSGDIYQICPVFRGQERGRRHNPEFTLLEWYRLDFDHHRLMDEVDALLLDLLGSRPPAERIRYREAFERRLGLDPLTAPDGALVDAARQLDSEPPQDLAPDERDAWLDWLMTQAVAPGFAPDRPTFVFDYPASQCALARLQPGSPPTAARFELYWGDLELANGYHELSDAAEQASRFEAERARRRARGESDPAADALLLAALEQGLPDCAGVALGLDRLLMLALGAEHIDAVLSFPWERV